MEPQRNLKQTYRLHFCVLCSKSPALQFWLAADVYSPPLTVPVGHSTPSAAATAATTIAATSKIRALAIVPATLSPNRTRVAHWQRSSTAFVGLLRLVDLLSSSLLALFTGTSVTSIFDFRVTPQMSRYYNFKKNLGTI